MVTPGAAYLEQLAAMPGDKRLEALALALHDVQ
jgi:hypothetical protein